MESLVLQYVIIFAALLAASYSIYKIIKKTFSPKKFDTIKLSLFGVLILPIELSSFKLSDKIS